MTWVDWAIAAFALFAALQGLRRGLLAALIGILAVVAAYLVASAWYEPLGAFLHDSVRLSPSWSDTVAFAALLLLVYDVIAILVVMAIRADRVRAALRLSGMVVGALRGVVLASALLVVALASPPAEPLRRDVDRSAIAPYAVTAYRGGLRTLAGVLPSGIAVFGTEDVRF